MDKSDINRLLKEVLHFESENRPSIECYPHHLNFLHQLFSVLYKEFNYYNGNIPEKVIQEHVKYLNFAKKVLESGLSHADQMLSALPAPAANPLPRARPPSYSSSVDSVASTHSTRCNSLPPTISSQEKPVAPRRVSGTLPLLPRQESAAPAEESSPHAFAALNWPQYEMFAPESPAQRISRQNRAIEARLARLSSPRAGRKADTSSMRLRFERQKIENRTLGEKEQKEYMASVTRQATRVCNDSVYFFRKYPEHFASDEFQLLYRQAALYNSFYLHENALYQRLFRPRRVAERCVTFMLRDARHPLVSFMHALPRRHLEDVRVASALEEVAEKKAAVERAGRAFAKDFKLLADVITLIISHSNVKNERLEVFEEEAEDLMPYLSRTIFSQTQEGRDLHRLAIEQLALVKAEDVCVLKELAQRSPQELREFTGVSPALVSASPEEDAALFSEGARLIAKLSEEFCPFTKLHIIGQATTALVDAAAHGSGLCNATNLGADELSPMFAYGLLLWQQPQLPAQIQFVDCFVPEEALLGLDGYSLTSMLISVDFCKRNTPGAVASSA